MRMIQIVALALLVSFEMGYAFGSFDMPKCSDKDVIAEVEMEIIRQATQEMAGEDDEDLQGFMELFLKEVDVKIFKIITHHIDRDLKMVGCEADMQMIISKSMLNKLTDFVLEASLKSVTESLSINERRAFKAELEQEKDGLKQMLRVAFADLTESVDIMYQARRTDDGYLSVEVMMKQ